MTGGGTREKLYAATSAVHERLHLHSGLAAAASGAISLDHYRALLMRLYGFHAAFDALMAPQASQLREESRSRSSLLDDDLAALGLTAAQRSALPLCERLPAPTQRPQALGALYVIEGSALGGATIARALAPLLAPLDGAACRFFSNDGGRRRVWPALLKQIETLQGDAEAEQVAIDAAIATFQLFDDWMQGWMATPVYAPGSRAEV